MSDGMRRELVYLSSYATNRYFIPNWGSHYYVSGTASIDNHGDVLYLGDVERQTYRLLENVEALLADGEAKMSDIRYFIVYLRDISDYEVVDAVFSSRFPSVPYIIVHGKVCRPEWLVEAECIAEK